MYKKKKRVKTKCEIENTKGDGTHDDDVNRVMFILFIYKII